jgi:hypothetical protein
MLQDVGWFMDVTETVAGRHTYHYRHRTDMGKLLDLKEHVWGAVKGKQEKRDKLPPLPGRGVLIKIPTTLCRRVMTFLNRREFPDHT